MTTNTQSEEILAKQVAEWRKEVARLNDLIAHAEGRDSQAASIADDEKFVDLVYWYDRDRENQKRLFEYVDSLIKQAREEGRRDSHETNVTMLNLKLKAEESAAIAEKKRADEAEEWQEIEKEFSHFMEQRATAAESRLAEIQRGVEGLTRWRDEELCYGKPEIAMLENGAGEYLKRAEVLALLQPQGQADTSGLPG